MKKKDNILVTKSDTKNTLGGIIPVVNDKGIEIADDPRYVEMRKNIPTLPDEKFKFIHPISGREVEVVIGRQGTPERALIEVLIDPVAPQDKKDAILGNYLWSRGKESASMFTELMVWKGTHSKEQQAFKKQMRFDYEVLVGSFVHLFLDAARNIRKDLEDTASAEETLERFAERMESMAEKLKGEVDKVTLSRMREKGFGMYINNEGKAFDHFDDMERELAKDKQQHNENNRDGDSK